jgi:HAD superfamily hydrolase (TIGR01662 family)
MLNLPIELVLFDLGSTLFYQKGSWDGLYQKADAELWRVLRGAGVTLQPHDLYGDAGTLIEFYSGRRFGDLREPTIAAALAELLRSEGIALGEPVVQDALRAMYAVTQTNWEVEEDAMPTLRRLRNDGFQVGAISNASDDGNTQALVDKSGVRPYLQFLISSAAFGMRKPHPSIFRLALDHFSIDPARAVMVGDDYEADVLGAHGVGMQAIWITRRVEPPLPEMSRGAPEAVVETLSGIPALLEAR